VTLEDVKSAFPQSGGGRRQEVKKKSETNSFNAKVLKQ